MLPLNCISAITLYIYQVGVSVQKLSILSALKNAQPIDISLTEVGGAMAAIWENYIKKAPAVLVFKLNIKFYFSLRDILLIRTKWHNRGFMLVECYHNPYPMHNFSTDLPQMQHQNSVKFYTFSKLQRQPINFSLHTILYLNENYSHYILFLYSPQLQINYFI